MKKKLLLLTLCLLAGMGCWAQEINIGGHRAVLDTLNNIWLCSIPQDSFGQNYTATVTYDTEVRALVIDGTSVANEGTYTFSRVEGGKNYTVTAYKGNELITGHITFTWLPIVELEGEFGNSYRYGTVRVNEPDSAYAEPLMAKLKWRGIATNDGVKHKRNYRIKFVNEDSTKANHRFFGLRNDNCWILDAGQRDFLRVRNRVSTDLWLDYARKPWYADTVANVRNGSRGQMVEVLLNGAYMGIYNMCEPIDRKQLKLQRYDEENKKFHGVLWDAFKRTSTTNMNNPADKVYNSKTWAGFEIKYPDYEEIGMSSWKALDEAVRFAKRADDSDIQLRIDSMQYHFDLPVMQDYYLLVTVLQALDNECKNIYYACYDTQGSHVLTMIPWDLDICLGGAITPGSNYPDLVKPERGVTEWMTHLPMADMLEVKEYCDQLNERYFALRQTKFHTDSLVNRYWAAIDNLVDCGAAAREEARWSKDTDIAKKELNLVQEMQYVEDWIRRRMTYLDENVFPVAPPETPDPPQPGLTGDVNLDGMVNISDINAVIDIILAGGFSENADVNGDGVVNISDINMIIGIIL